MCHTRCGAKGLDRDGRAHGLGFNIDDHGDQTKKKEEKDSTKEDAEDEGKNKTVTAAEGPEFLGAALDRWEKKFANVIKWR